MREERAASMLRRISSYALLGVAAALAVAPLWHVGVLAFEPVAHSNPEAAWRLPIAPGWGNFARLLTETDFTRWVALSLIHI